MKRFWLLFFLFMLIGGSLADEDQPQYVIRGKTTNLTCPIDITNCGELHSIKWFMGDIQIAVVSGDGEIRKVEEAYADRYSIEYIMDRPSLLSIKAVEIEDQDVYLCEVTYIDPLDGCDSTGAYRTNLVVEVNPSLIALVYDDEVIKNGSVIGPLKEGQKFDVTCEVRDTRPKPIVGWYRKGAKLTSHETLQFENELYTVKTRLSLELSRQDLSNALECRVKTTEMRPIVSNRLNIDLIVKPTIIKLTGVKDHTVEGSRVNLECKALGARPAANISWYNSTEKFDSSSVISINTKSFLQSDGTFETISNVIFTATRFENSAVIKCMAENIVMIEDMDKPLSEYLELEVMYPPVVTVNPRNLTINETEEILLFCGYEANPNSLISVRWFRNDEIINLNQSRIDGGNTEQTALLIKNANRGDSGNYSCELTNLVGTGISDGSVVVDVQYKPAVAIRFDPPSPIIESHKSNVTLHCEVLDSNPVKLTKVQWMIDSNLLTELPECNNLDENDVDDEENSKNQNYFCFIDPTKILLQNVNREFLGNYSCRGFNAAGWGEISDPELLDVYYEPANATISVSPVIPIKGQLMNLSCYVDDLGNPRSSRFQWLRGNELVKDIVTSVWTIDPAGLHSRNNYSCYAVNSGGNGTIATINVDLHVAPAMIRTLPPYTGYLFSEPNINLSCRVECVPTCSIYWFRDGQEILSNDQKYLISQTNLPADSSTGDFESVLSELIFNISAWPGRKLDIIKDSVNYTCISSNNSVGPGARTFTSFRVEYPPENVTIYPQEQTITEGEKPSTLTCFASAHPAPTIIWKRIDTNETLQTSKSMSSSKLVLNKPLSRIDKGVYTCIAENRHGFSMSNISINIQYSPNCTIKQDWNDDGKLICVGDGNPTDYIYEWDFKSENETEPKVLRYETKGKISILTLEDSTYRRIYMCRANNSVGAGSFCELTVDGKLLWYQNLLPLTPLILVAVLLICLIGVVTLIIIIICACRRQRKRSSKSMEKSLMDSKPLEYVEPSENYENLPFHGMQNPPPKFDYLSAPANNLNVNLVHHQQKSFASHPYSSDFYYENHSNTDSRNSIRNVQSYRKPKAPTGIGPQNPSNKNYNMYFDNSSTLPLNQEKYTDTNNLNYHENSYKKLNNYLNSKKTIREDSVQSNTNSSNLSRRSSQSSGSHEWPQEKTSLSLCINRINVKKSSTKPAPTSNNQFQSMRCRKHRNRNHFFNTSATTSYQKYKLTKSCSNDTDISDHQNEIEKKNPNSYKFV